MRIWVKVVMLSAYFAIGVVALTHAQDWQTVEDCIAEMGDGNPNNIVSTPPSLFSKETPQRAADWCENHVSESSYRRSELTKAGVGALIFVTAFVPLIIFTVVRAQHRRNGRHLLSYVPRDNRLAFGQKWSFVGAVILLNAIVIASCVLNRFG
jgi:hypothetical protein